MTIVQKYVCDICGILHDCAKDAIECESIGVTPPKCKVGDTVFVSFKYHNSADKPFCRRLITEVITCNRHKAEYVFDKMVCVANGNYIGLHGFAEGGGLAGEDDFYLLGEVLDVFDIDFDGKIMSLDFVDETA